MAKKKTAAKPKQPGGTELRKLRSAIDRLDKEILAKLNERAELARELGEIKGRSGTAAYDADRERQVLAKLLKQNRGPLSDDCVQAVFRELISGSRALQAPLKVAFLGPQYSYSHLAAIKRFGHSAELAPVGSISAAFEEVDAGQVDFAVVPIENSTDGRIVDTLGMFARLPTQVCAEVQLRIHHHLLGNCRRDEIKVVCSKPQAISQCREWLGKHLPGVEIRETASTTAAAEIAAEEQGVAAIASRQAGINYGLGVIAERIEDNPQNITRFAVIGKQPAEKTGNDKTALMFEVAHEPGALADAMNIFKRQRLNLTWIESFPLVGTQSEYLFFVELEGHHSDLRLRRAIGSLEKKTRKLNVLGSYEKTEPVD